MPLRYYLRDAEKRESEREVRTEDIQRHQQGAERDREEDAPEHVARQARDFKAEHSPLPHPYQQLWLS